LGGLGEENNNNKHAYLQRYARACKYNHLPRCELSQISTKYSKKLSVIVFFWRIQETKEEPGTRGSLTTLTVENKNTAKQKTKESSEMSSLKLLRRTK
jgi:hypothetical protein